MKTKVLSVRQCAGVKRIAQNVNPLVVKKNKIAAKIDELNREYNSLSEEIEGHEGSVDAVVAFPHNYGCSQLGDDHENTRKILADIVHHPNAAGVLVVALGCENNQLQAFRELVGPVDGSRVRFMECQKIEGDEVGYGVAQLKEIAEACADDRREEIPVSELRVGLKCGGSDGFSGITANPLLGRFSDWIVSQDGTTVLTEVPEMFGAETILMARCANEEIFGKTVSLINDFKEYFISNRQPVYENPSPGNKAGGISTLEEKSLGCTQKSGKSAVTVVLKYGERLRTRGHCIGSFRLPDSTFHHGKGNSVRNVRADGEDIHEQQDRLTEARLDRFQCRSHFGRQACSLCR